MKNGFNNGKSKTLKHDKNTGSYNDIKICHYSSQNRLKQIKDGWD